MDRPGRWKGSTNQLCGMHSNGAAAWPREQLDLALSACLACIQREARRLAHAYQARHCQALSPEEIEDCAQDVALDIQTAARSVVELPPSACLHTWRTCEQPLPQRVRRCARR